MNELTEIRWHARAGQGAKTASQLLALALLRSGKSVQAFPEYGPERRGAPLRAFTRVSDRPIRRHDTITDPDLVIVLEQSRQQPDGGAFDIALAARALTGEADVGLRLEAKAGVEQPW